MAQIPVIRLKKKILDLCNLQVGDCFEFINWQSQSTLEQYWNFNNYTLTLYNRTYTYMVYMMYINICKWARLELIGVITFVIAKTKKFVI